MSSDYSKMKNAELEALLKDRQLPAGGKKADMVARLVEDDQQKSATTTAPPAAVDAQAATTSPAAAAIAAGGTATRAPNPVDVPNQAQAVDPAATSDLSVAQDTTTSTSAPLDATASADVATAASDFSSHLAPTDVDAEIAKRKARAAKFGIKEDDSEAIRALERAKRFGTGMPGEQQAGAAAESGSMGMRRLDEALPERRDRKRGRGEQQDALEDDGLRRRRGGGRFRGRGGRVEKRQRTDGVAASAGGKASWMSEADQAAAERRKNRFATAT